MFGNRSGLRAETFDVNIVFRGAAGALAWVLAPPRCAACDAAMAHSKAFCPPCAATLVRASNHEAGATAAFVYGGAIAQAVRRFKFEDRPDLVRPLLAGLHTLLPLLRSAAADVVVPVPLHPARLVERGYNQAALLSGPIAAWLGLASAPRALRRLIATDRQTELTRSERVANVRDAFVAVERKRLLGQSVLLVDDVETTGATLDACRRALLEGGARAVGTVVVARVESASAP